MTPQPEKPLCTSTLRLMGRVFECQARGRKHFEAQSPRHYFVTVDDEPTTKAVEITWYE